MPAGLSRLLGLAGLGLVAVLALVWALGGFDALAAQALAAQRSFRDALAGALRALRSGQDGALWGLVALGFGYGVLHAAGPGHGKVLIGAYGVARRVALVRLAGLALAASLAQATVAVALVYGGLGLFGATREAIGAAGDGSMVALGNAMMAGIGAWLVWRGGRGLIAGRGTRPQHRPDHTPAHHPHDHHDHTHTHPAGAAPCTVCGHAHGPTLAQAEAATGWREAAALIAGVAVRPCTGALMLLVLTWQLGLVWAGVLGTYAMGLGTALVTIGAAVLAVTAREGAFAGFPALARTRAALPLIELLAGALIATVALVLLFRGG
jgi:ABC-type nickel/cobalt efflux system permease component RcnA